MVNGERDDLRFVVAVVVGDLNGEGIAAVEVGVGGVGPGAGGGVDGCGAVGGSGADGEVGCGGAVCGVCECEGAGDGRVVLITGACGVTGEGAGVVDSIDGEADGLRFLVALVVGDLNGE